jgi:hypothetical protein
MPRVGDLSKCKIYKIVSMNNPDMVYYGQTCQTLSQRFATHKSPSNPTTSKLIIEKGDAIIVLVEEYPCNSIMEASARESFYILNNHCVNKQIPGKIMEKNDRKNYNKNYYETNKDKILEKLTSKITCEICNRTVSYNNLNKHYTLPICERTKLRNDFIASRKLI